MLITGMAEVVAGVEHGSSHRLLLSPFLPRPLMQIFGRAQVEGERLMLESGLRLALGVQCHKKSRKSGARGNKHRKNDKHSRGGRDQLRDSETKTARSPRRVKPEKDGLKD